MLDIFSVEGNKVSKEFKTYCNLIYGPPKAGKGHLLDDVILTDRGYEKVRNLNLGDTIFGEDGKPYEIEGYYSRGKQDFYTITFTDGAEITVSDDHLWNVELEGESTYKTYSTLELLKDDRGIGGKIPMTKPVDYGVQQTLGSQAYEMGKNEISPTEEILFGSIKDRWSYLKGLLWNRETDSSYRNPDMAMLLKVKMMIHSLGGSCTLDKDCIAFSLIGERRVQSITPAGNHECICIKTTNPTELYLAKDCIVTHNTTIASKFPKHLVLAFEIGLI